MFGAAGIVMSAWPARNGTCIGAILAPMQAAAPLRRLGAITTHALSSSPRQHVIAGTVRHRQLGPPVPPSRFVAEWRRRDEAGRRPLGASPRWSVRD